jgi:formylglycine-generating enzyme required for sulfatase activity
MNQRITGAAAVFCAAILMAVLVACPDPGGSTEPKSSEAALKSLTASPGTLEPAFAPDTTDYAVAVANGAASITLRATASHAGAVVSGGGSHSLNAGANRIAITVISEDESAERIYSVTASRAGTGTGPATVNFFDLRGLVRAPVKGAIPDAAVSHAQYTGTIVWQDAGGTAFEGPVFAAGTIYKAVIALQAATGYTFAGVAAGSFAYTGAVVTHRTGSGTVTIVFPATGTASGEAYAFATPAEHRALALVNSANLTIIGSGSEGAFIEGRTVTLTPYRIAKYETTWQLWKEVYDWAVSEERGAGKYTFANPGVEGHGANGTGTNGNEAERITRSVTFVNWRDALVWCNAYSEMSGLTPVYYLNNTYGTALRASSNATQKNTAADMAVIKADADGYRLPTEAQWECAARGGDPAAGDWSYVYAGSNVLGDVAWHSGNAASGADRGVHPVGQKAANRLGLYDMTGNVEEWVGDRSVSITADGAVTDPVGSGNVVPRLPKGGSHNSVDPDAYLLSHRVGLPVYRARDNIGFRVARTGN